MLNEFLNSPKGWIALAAIGVIFGMYLMRRYQKSREKYEGTELEEVVHDDIYDYISKHGVEVGKPLTKDLHKLGVIRKREKLKVNPSERDDDGEPENEEEESIYYRLIVRKSGLVWKILSSGLFKPLRSRWERTYVIPEEWIEEDRDRVNLQQNAEFRKVGGTYMAVEEGAFEHVKSMVWSKVMNDDLERHANWIEFYNWRDRGISREFHTMEKQHELEEEKWSARDRRRRSGEG